MADDGTPTRAEPTREQALEAAAATDAAAFGRLFDLHVVRVYGFVARRVDDRQTAEEVTSIAFARALDALRGGGLGSTMFGAFLHLVAATALVDHELRRRREIPAGVRASDLRRAGGDDADAAAVDELAARAFAAAVDRDARRRSLQQLSERQRRIVLLKYLDGLEPDEMGSVLRCSRQELAIELHRALRVLRGGVDREASGAA